MFTIYKITNKVNNKIYVGMTCRKLSERFLGHKHGNKTLMSKKIKQYGAENFSIEPIDYANNLKEASIKEIYWIEKLNSFAEYGTGYNLTRGGQNYIPLGGNSLSEETKEKIRQSKLGKKRSKELCSKLSEIKTKQCNTEEGKAKMKAMRQRQMQGGTWDKMKQKIIERRAKKWEITTKDGRKFVISNLSEFCRANGLNECYMRNMALGLNRGKWNNGFHCEKYQEDIEDKA